MARISRAVQRANAVLTGSWQRGDFHLSIETGVSFSDIDLVATRAIHEWPDITAVIQDDIRPLGVAKVSIHPPSSFDGLSLHDGFVLNLAEYVYAMLRSRGLDQGDYGRAKLALRLCRASDGETMTDTARRIGTDEALQALLVKLGYALRLEKHVAVDLVGSQCRGGVEIRRLAAQLIGCVRGVDAIDLIDRLQKCTSLPLWLRKYQAAKLNRASNSSD